jgi:hypothetical protein
MVAAGARRSAAAGEGLIMDGFWFEEIPAAFVAPAVRREAENELSRLGAWTGLRPALRWWSPLIAGHGRRTIDAPVKALASDADGWTNTPTVLNVVWRPPETRSFAERHRHPAELVSHEWSHGYEMAVTWLRLPTPSGRTVKARAAFRPSGGGACTAFADALSGRRLSTEYLARLRWLLEEDRRRCHQEDEAVGALGRAVRRALTADEGGNPAAMGGALAAVQAATRALRASLRPADAATSGRRA